MVLKNPADITKLLENLDSLHPGHPHVNIKPNGRNESVQLDSQVQKLSEWKSKTKVAVQAYRGTGRVSDSPIVAMKAIAPSDPNKELTFERPTEQDALICQSMANLKLSAAMELQSGEPREQCRSIKITERFEEAITKVTGRNFSFQVARHPDLHLEVKWGGASMKLGVLPDGLRSIIAWLIACIAKLESQFPDDPDPLDIPLILLLDEPESHLHPAWQRQVLPAAQRLFPNAQILAVTHSPFVISSVNSGWIHVLRMDEKGVVKADKPVPCSKGDSYLDVVEDVLGLTQWYDPETEALLAEFRSLRDAVSKGDASLETLEAKAKIIGDRSDSLKGMMAREIHQVRTILTETTVAQ
ncbi:MAG: AAA family ATPase [Planctomycetaceae bacterium]